MENGNDSHGANHLSATPTVTYPAGKVNNCFHIPYNNTGRLYIANGDQTGLDCNGKSYSLSFWAYFQWAWRFYPLIKTNTWSIYNTNDYLRFWSIGETGGSHLLASTTTGITAAWHHWVLTYDYTTKQKLIYYDNINKGDAIATHGNNVGQNSNDFEFGGTTDTANRAGWMDEFGFWDRVLTPAEVTTLYNSGNGMSYNTMLTLNIINSAMKIRS